MNICSPAFIDQLPLRRLVHMPASGAAWCMVSGSGRKDSRGGDGVAEKCRHRRRKPIGIYTYPHKIISQAPYKKGGGGCENPKPEKF